MRENQERVSCKYNTIVQPSDLILTNSFHRVRFAAKIHNVGYRITWEKLGGECAERGIPPIDVQHGRAPSFV
jgi:hypothetical protein